MRLKSLFLGVAASLVFAGLAGGENRGHTVEVQATSQVQGKERVDLLLINDLGSEAVKAWLEEAVTQGGFSLVEHPPGALSSSKTDHLISGTLSGSCTPEEGVYEPSRPVFYFRFQLYVMVKEMATGTKVPILSEAWEQRRPQSEKLENAFSKALQTFLGAREKTVRDQLEAYRKGHGAFVETNPPHSQKGGQGIGRIWPFLSDGASFLADLVTIIGGGGIIGFILWWKHRRKMRK